MKVPNIYCKYFKEFGIFLDNSVAEGAKTIELYCLYTSDDGKFFVKTTHLPAALIFI